MLSAAHGNIVMGLLAALLWGAGDFSGGMGAKSTGGSIQGALRIILLSHSTSFCILVALALLRGDSFPHGAPLIWGISAGVTGGLSLTCFYIALAQGAMGAAAAVSGLCAAAIPAIVSIVNEGFPGMLRLLGFLIAGVAIWMIATASAEVPKCAPRSALFHPMTLAVIAGVGFGIYFVCLKMAGSVGIIWPMGTARMGSITTCLIMLFCLPRTGGEAAVEFPKAALLWSLTTALLDTAGNLLFVAATRVGRLDVAAVLASLYPASTIMLATWVLRERFTSRQAIGMAMAVAAVVIITLQN